VTVQYYILLAAAAIAMCGLCSVNVNVSVLLCVSAAMWWFKTVNARANAMPTGRFEAGYYMGKAPHRCVYWVPDSDSKDGVPRSEQCGWIKAHAHFDVNERGAPSIMEDPVDEAGFVKFLDLIFQKCEQQAQK